jgi:hypothetical protein
MLPLLQRAFAAVRVWLGMNDAQENHLHATHGWLLPEPAVVRARARVAPEAPADGWPRF